MTEAHREFIVLVEAEADFVTATGIAEKVIWEYSPEWVREVLEISPSSLFSWAGLIAETPFSCWSNYKIIESQFEQNGYRPPRFLGHDHPRTPDYAAGKKVLLLIEFIKNRYQRNIPAVLFIRDGDNQAEDRLSSFIALRNEYSKIDIQVIVGLAVPKREAWVLNGFDPQNENEIQLLDKVRRELTLDPCTEAHRLRGKVNQPGIELRDIKRVLMELVDNNPLREEQCWRTTSLDILITRGNETGLTDYIDNIREFMIPILVRN